ncbi:MAG: NAD-dependent epimerase/dehydratase family protein [Candidatus Omnitrophica bacterium]|nr:NAD-dependent epimerase/dehydratase family protein [Candidatus Omnitrophota bacterium]
MKKVLITGGCGFVGSNLAVAFSKQGYQVTSLDNFSRKGSEILKTRIQGFGVEVVGGDVRNVADLNDLKGPFDLMIEACAEPSVLAGVQGKDARYVLDVNLLGAINCFEWARERHVPVIFLSSSRVYPYDRLNACHFLEKDTRFVMDQSSLGLSPSGVSIEMPLEGIRSLYGATKLSAEFILKEYAVNYRLPSIVNRCGVIAGPWQLGKVDQGVFTYWLSQHYFNKALSYIGYGGKGKQVRDLLHIDDLTDLILKQAACLMGADSSFRGDIFNVGGSLHSNLSLLETTEICQQLTGNRINVGRILEQRPADLMWYITDNGKTEKVFDWQPKHSAQKILEDTHIWLRENETLFKQVFV